MKKSLSLKPARKPRSSQFEMTPAMEARMQKAMVSIGNIADKEARMAIAETFDAWLDWLEETAPEQVEDIFFELGCFATATNRRRMFKNAKAPEGVAERAQEQVDRWKAEVEAARAAQADDAQGESGDADGHA